MSEKNVAVLEDYKNRLKGIQRQISSLTKDASAFSLRGIHRPAGNLCRTQKGPIHPAGAICDFVVKDIDTWTDCLDALNKIHQWTGYVIKVLDLNLKGIKPVKK
jgi:hypothetical protein